jgi:hypothetical protein
VLVVAGALLLPSFRWHLGPDGVSYLSIAEHLAAGRWSAVVNGYWSPLTSWLSAPLLLIGVDPLVAAKLVDLAVAVATLVAVDRLLVVVPVGRRARLVTSLGLVPFVLHAAVTWIGPDLLVAVPVLVLTERVVSGAWRASGRAAVLTGAAGGVAYLAKLYALPVVVVALAGAVLLAARRDGVAALHRGTAAVAGLLLVAAPWALAISLAEGRPTVGTAASVNAEVLAPGSLGAPVLRDGLFEPPHPHAISVWEDPARTAPRPGTDTPEASVRGAPDVRAAEGDDRGDDATASPLAGITGLLTNVPDNLATTWQVTRELAGVALLAVAGVIATSVATGPPGRRGRVLGAVAVAAVWAGGLQLLVAHPRYLWTAALLLTPAVAVTIDRVRRRWLVIAVSVVALLAWLPLSVATIEERRDDGRSAALLATQLAPSGVTSGDRIAFGGAWNLGPTTCHHLDCRFLGVPRRGAGDAEVLAELRDHDVGWYLVRDTPPAPLVATQVAEVRTVSGTSFTLHRVPRTDAT